MKIIFLDIDGVLILPPEWGKIPDPNCLEQLFRIIKETDAKVILSSSWRCMEETFEEVIKMHLWRFGDLHKYLIGETRHPTFAIDSHEREIEKWLEEDYRKIMEEQPDSFVILDDMEMLGPLKLYAVHCKWADGLSREKADLAIKILQK